MIDETRLSSYLDDLPAIYREKTSEEHPNFLGRFLLAFEHVLTGVGDRTQPGLEEMLEGAHCYFTPGPDDGAYERAPDNFLEWLSGWVALTLRDDWDEDERRRMLAGIVPSYLWRGTLRGLQQALAAFTGVHPSAITITELLQPFQIGTESIVGTNLVLGGGPPHYFMVRVLVPGTTDLGRKRAALQAIIDLEKPAHTTYDLFIQTPTIRVGETSTVGNDTVLGIAVKTQ